MNKHLKRQLNAQKKRTTDSTAEQLLSQAEALFETNTQQAVQYYSQFIEKYPYQDNVFIAYFRLAQVARRSGNIAKAIELLTQSIRYNAEFYLSYIDLGFCYSSINELESSYNFYRHAISLISPSDNPSLAYMGVLNCCGSLQRYEEGLQFINQALELRIDEATFLDRKAFFLHSSGQHEEALKVSDQLIGIAPHVAQNHFNKAEILRHLADHQASIASYETALSYDPTNIDFHVNYSHQLLATGNYEKGWEEHEYRRHKKGLFRIFKNPHWDGKISLENKTILLYAEQGFGDSIQFSRYIPLLKKQYNNVNIIFQCHPELVTLLAQFSDINQIFSYDDKVENLEFDYHCSVMSLPYYLGTTSFELVPYSKEPYLTPPSALKQFWHVLLKQHTSFKIGIVWNGAIPKKENNDVHPVPELRNASLLDFKPLLEIPGCTFFSLQKGPSYLDIAKYGLQSQILDYSSKFSDFADTAAFISELDLVIGVDTAVIHLASAIGKPTWLLSRHTGCWRWLTEKQMGQASPWYPLLKVYHQKTRNNWSTEFEQIYQHLLAFSGN